MSSEPVAATPDSSVVIAAFASWNQHHEPALEAGLLIAGGAVYDALVAATAAHHGYRLLSCDRRATATYERLGVEVTYL